MGRRKKSRWLLWTTALLVILVAAAVAVPFVVPASHYLPELTRIASEKLGQPVVIADLELRVLPTPRVVASGIRIGKKDEVKVGEVEVIPELMSLFSSPKTIRLIRAEKLEVKESALALAKAMPKSAPGEPVHVRRIVLREVRIYHSKVKVPDFDVEAELAPGLRLDLARIETRDGRLKLTADPHPSGATAVSATATNWTLPAGPPLAFESLVVNGMLKGDMLDLPKIGGRLYGGTFGGSARGEWAKLWQASGKVHLEGVDIVPVQKALRQKPQLSGRLKADTTFSARARAPELLADALALDGPFEVVDGAYSGADLTKVGVTSSSTAGVTKFSEFKGDLQLRGRLVKIENLCMRSPALVAGGRVEVAPDEKLSGKLDISVAKTGGFVGIPVALAGTASSPSIRPTKGYVIGAVVGTVLLPGIGTTIGSSVGSRIEGKSDCK